MTEAFLARELGGRSEPLGDFPGSTITCPDGAEGVPGLSAALKHHEAEAAKSKGAD